MHETDQKSLRRSDTQILSRFAIDSPADKVYHAAMISQ
jgi:hypothetical protein